MLRHAQASGRAYHRPFSYCRFGLFAIVAGIAIFVAPFGAATDKVWTGASDTAWGTNGNWTGNAPASGDHAVFNSTFTNQPGLTGNKTAGRPVDDGQHRPERHDLRQREHTYA